MDEFAENCASLSVLIVAYRRWQNVSQILDLCHIAGVDNIYLSLDAPKATEIEAVIDHEEMKKVIQDFESNTGRNVKKRIASENQGCAVNVILGCDWAFKDSSFLAILEDDCIPSIQFFEFCRASVEYLLKDEDCWLLCGTQFAPRYVTGNQPSLSRYALTWGWATHVEKWQEIRTSFFSPSKFPEFYDLLSIHREDAFWNAGARRAIRGFTDVWDTLLVQQMHLKNKFAILPPSNLIENVGDDSVATHLISNSKWTNRPVNAVSIPFDRFPIFNNEMNQWLTKHFYQIELSHVFSTKITLLLDSFFRKQRRKFRLDLKNRLFS